MEILSLECIALVLNCPFLRKKDWFCSDCEISTTVFYYFFVELQQDTTVSMLNARRSNRSRKNCMSAVV